MKYKIVQAVTPTELEGLVQGWLNKDDWRLIGSVFTYTVLHEDNYVTEYLCRELVLEEYGSRPI